jgi:hypothetical protein
MTQNKNEETEGLPPFVKSWKMMYWLLTLALLVQIVFYFLFMNNFQ